MGAGECQPTLVVLEDDPITRSMIAGYFSKNDFDVHEAATTSECQAILRRIPVDLLFIDIRLPDGNGITFAQEIRLNHSVGIIFVTQKDNEGDLVLGLETAGDDYVTKPVNLRELMARARALLRRLNFNSLPQSARNVVTFGSCIMDLTRRELSSQNGERIKLTRGEFDLLAALIAAKGLTLYRDYLAEVVSSRESDSRTVDTMVARIRRKLSGIEDGDGTILTVPGLGYRFGKETASL